MQNGASACRPYDDIEAQFPDPIQIQFGFRLLEMPETDASGRPSVDANRWRRAAGFDLGQYGFVDRHITGARSGEVTCIFEETPVHGTFPASIGSKRPIRCPLNNARGILCL